MCVPLYTGGNVPVGYIADPVTQAFLPTLPMPYAFTTGSYTYSNYLGWPQNPNICGDYFMSGGAAWVRGFQATGAAVDWSTPPYSGVFIGNEKVGVGRDDPEESVHVSWASTGMTIISITGVTTTGTISYTTGPLMGSLYAVKLGVLTNGYHCPCDTNANIANNCDSTVHTRPYPTYNYAIGAQTCYDVDIANDGFYSHPMNVSFASNLFTLSI